MLITGCSNENIANREKIIAVINGCNLSLDEFNTKLEHELEFHPQYKSTAEAKKEFLQSLIKKELLIQEALNSGLDKNKEFVIAIEQYWEATLIKNLMEFRNHEIKKQTYVSTKEIKNRYSQLKSINKNLPEYEKVKNEIAGSIRQEKNTKALNQWLDELNRKAAITINEQYL